MEVSENTHQIYSFLKRYPPFDLIDEDELYQLATAVKSQTYYQGEKMFLEGDTPLPYFFVVCTGSIRVSTSKENILVDECDEGDIFGVRASIANDAYLANAIAEEKTVLYTVPLDKFSKIMEGNSKVALYLTTGFASGVTILKTDPSENIKNLQRFLEDNKSQKVEIDALKLPHQKQIIDCTPQHTVREAAKIMSIFNVGSILVTNAQKHPLGMITDTDFRKKVVAAEETIKHNSVTEIMSAPVKTIKPNLSVAEVMLIMVSKRVSHLCVTEDGTANSPAISVVSQRDVLIAQGNNPSVIAKQMLKTYDVNRLKEIREQAEGMIRSYLQKDIGASFISNIITEINDVLVQQAIDITIRKLSQEELFMPEIKYCWFSLGSEGRKEQLLRSEQDNILVYENPGESEKERVHAYFLRFAKEVNTILEHCGFEKCNGNTLAGNVQWCQPLAVWQEYFAEWIHAPDAKSLIRVTLFFDFRPTAGDMSLAHLLKNFVYSQIDKKPAFLGFLAKNTLQNPPPLSFFRNFIVEKSGNYKNAFDIKSRAMMPLVDAARVLAYDFQLKNYGGTSERFQQVARMDESLKNVCELGAMAFEILLKKRAMHGLQNQNSGRYIRPNALNKLERQMLRNTFKAVEKIQQALENRYRLGYLR